MVGGLDRCPECRTILFSTPGETWCGNCGWRDSEQPTWIFYERVSGDALFAVSCKEREAQDLIRAFDELSPGGYDFSQLTLYRSAEAFRMEMEKNEQETEKGADN